ncbi:hypothetical protein [Ruminococcus sp.]|nr:hypothetical protein [Ruminococcus sp.]MEE3492828.1 hypothetical protein [Ruminococcus sp.]
MQQVSLGKIQNDIFQRRNTPMTYEERIAAAQAKEYKERFGEEEAVE